MDFILKNGYLSHTDMDFILINWDLSHTNMDFILKNWNLSHTDIDFILKNVDLSHTDMDFILKNVDLSHTDMDFILKNLDLSHTDMVFILKNGDLSHQWWFHHQTCWDSTKELAEWELNQETSNADLANIYAPKKNLAHMWIHQQTLGFKQHESWMMVSSTTKLNTLNFHN